MRILSQSDTTVVPPVTEQKSPPDSRTTGADSPVMADSSTEAMPSMGACAIITLGLRVWPGALDALATGLYAHVQPERLPYDSPLSQHFAKTRQLGERTAKFDDRMDELCRDTIKNTIISLIYGDKDTDHSEAVSYELSKLEKLDAQCWIVAAAEKYLEDRQ